MLKDLYRSEFFKWRRRNGRAHACVRVVQQPCWTSGPVASVTKNCCLHLHQLALPNRALVGYPEYTMLYNNGYIPVLGVTKHPGWLGRSDREAWKEIWSTVGPMALKMIEDWKPDVVVSDIALPEMDGYDFMRRLREIEGDGKRIPAIAVTVMRARLMSRGR